MAELPHHAGFIESPSQGWLGGMMLGKLPFCVDVTYANIVPLKSRYKYFLFPDVKHQKMPTTEF